MTQNDRLCLIFERKLEIWDASWADLKESTGKRSLSGRNRVNSHVDFAGGKYSKQRLRSQVLPIVSTVYRIIFNPTTVVKREEEPCKGGEGRADHPRR